ncbi:MAG TPA: hypothetical protein VHL11_04015 [Phototrophicaceae bacterium]|jgi:hypothetical protein|nr:hypothetical protein [Phototrophicaceae bacterium]
MTLTAIHPRPALYRRAQYLTAAVIGLTLLAVPLQLALGLLIRGAPLFFITAILTLLLVLPLLMQTTATPPVTVTNDGITLHPALWRERLITWDAIQSVKPYPLLPPADAEVMRKVMVGRKTYQPARGIMLVVPSLPWIYRAPGFFTGEGLTPVIALTNRTHTHYDDLVQEITARCGDRVLLTTTTTEKSVEKPTLKH